MRILESIFSDEDDGLKEGASEKEINLRPIMVFFHLLVYVTLFYSDSILRSSFLSKTPIYFYLFSTLYGMTLSLLDLSVEELEDEGSTEFNNQEICTICKKNVPPRGSHCAVCQKCFPFRDHHSRWLGTCISKENYANYVYLILLEILLSSLIIFDCIFTMYHSNSFTDFFTNKIPLFPTLLLSLLAFYLSVKNLKSIYLTISQNLNQYERKHRSKIPYLTGLPANALPFNHGFMNNLNEILSTNRKNETKTKAASPGESTL